MIESVAQQLVNDFAGALALDMQAAERATAAPAKPAEVRLGSLVARAWWQVFVDRLRALFSARS
jgi:hypothetical protein